MDPLQIGITVTSVMMFMIFFGMRVAFASALAGTAGLVWILSTKLGLEKAMFAGLGMAGTIPHSKSVTFASRIATYIYFDWFFSLPSWNNKKTI